MKGADSQVGKRWAEYFEELLKVKNEREAIIVIVGNGRRVPMFGDENIYIYRRADICAQRQ